MKKSKKTFIGMTFLALALAAISVFVLMGRNSVSAAAATSTAMAAQTSGMPVNIYTLTSDDQLFVLAPNTNVFVSLGRITNLGGNNLVGMDFRPADGQLYAVSDTQRIYTIDLSVSPPRANLVSTLTTRFKAGIQSLMDFNPVVDAIRLIGSNNQNLAVVNSNGGNLNATAAQTSVVYTAGDVNAGIDPELCSGSYTNNVAGAANTLFYAIDTDLDTLVTIADKNATGSSNTGGGQLQTIGRIRDVNGNLVNFQSTADIDIFTNASGVNTLAGISENVFFIIPLNQINPNLAVGTTQNVVVQGAVIASSPAMDSAIDFAITPLGSIW
jgi:Domain of unknown function (DUF4394)